MKQLKEMLEIISKSGYTKSDFKSTGLKHLQFMPLGSSLMQNIQNEWMKSYSDFNIFTGKNYVDSQSISHYNSNAISFMKTKYFKENFLFNKETFQNDFPLAIKTFLVTKQFDYINYEISLPKKTFMICDYFFNEAQAYEKFSKIQRERKIWWMKLSVDPGRFFLSDLNTDFIKKYKTQAVKIKAKFIFGDIDLEKICVIPLKALELEYLKEFYIFDKKLNKNVCPTIIHSEACAETAAITLLFDALENSNTEKLRLHRNISPYQCCIFCFLDQDEERQNIENLAIHLNSVLRKSNIRTLNLCERNVNNKLLEKELNHVDKLGVPYSLIINFKSLQNGLLNLRNRDTTLFEEIHITEVSDYLGKIFNK